MKHYYLKRKEFYSNLNMEDITDADYRNAEYLKRVFKNFKHNFLSAPAIAHINFETNPPPSPPSPFPSLSHYQCCLQVLVSETLSWHKLWCCYSAKILQH